MSKIVKIAKNPKMYFRTVLKKAGYYDSWSDEKYLKYMFKIKFGKDLDLDNPTTYSEKLQWLKLYNRRPEYTEMVDKYLVKDYVAAIIGDEYIIPTLGVWDSFDEIDFDTLPDQFVLKCNHDSGGLVICKDKSKLDLATAKAKIEKSMNNNYYLRGGREWPYKNVKKKIMAEAYMEDSKTQELRDYKFFGFDGDVRALFIASERQSADAETKFDVYDAEFNHLDVRWGHPNSEKKIEKPENFELMKELATKLSKGIPHVRVDFYEVDGRVYFGELTFFTYSGFTPFDPDKWDKVFGDWIILPEKNV